MRLKIGAMLFLGAIVRLVAQPVAFPLTVAPSQHYLVDQRGTPFFVQGDAPWYIIQRLNAADTDAYLSNRWTKGFNTILLDIASHEFGSGSSGQADVYGNLPFPKNAAGGARDFSRPNPAYFTNVDYVIKRAGFYGINVMLFPMYAGYQGGPQGWYQDMVANGSNVLYTYGQFIGNRYKGFTNILWVEAGDYTAPDKTLVDAVANGILSKDSNHLHTAHAGRGVSALDYYTSAWDLVNSTYTGTLTYQKSLADFNHSPVTPSLLIEAYYEGDNGATDLTCRQEAYGAVFSGAMGHIFGVGALWPYSPGWQSLLESPGSQSITNLIKLMRTRPWFNCSPDQNHALVTAGYGTLGTTDYITALRENGGKTALVYVPQDAMTFTVAMNRISGTQANAWWYNPANGDATLFGSFATSGSQSFTPPDASDWVLVLDDASQNYGAPGTLSPQLLTVLTASLPDGAVNTSYLFQLLANGGAPPYLWSVTAGALPPGLSLNSKGVLSGTLASTGTFNFTVQATDFFSAVATEPLVLVVNSTISGLVASYSFNEGSGTTVTDASGHGNNGTLSGTTWTAAGKYGNALSFNGTGFVTVPDSSSLDLTMGMTLEAWVNPTSTPTGWSTIVMKEQVGEFCYALYAGSPANQPSTWIFVNGEQGFSGPSALPLNTWSHLASTYDGATLRLYVNGIQVGSKAVTGSLFTSGQNLGIGGNTVWGVYEYFRGLIDEVRIYNRALSGSEIQSDMNIPVGGAPANAPPTITSLNNLAITAGGVAGPLNFTVGDAQTAASSLTVSGNSSNPTLVPNANIVFGGGGANRTVTMTPAADQTGNATITVTVSDGQLSASTSFVLTVNVPQPIGLVAAYSFNEGSGTTVTDASGHGNNGTMSGTTWTTGKFGSALSFNGTGFVSVPDSSALDLTTSMTLEAWVNPTSTPTGWSTIVMKEQVGGLCYALYAGSPANQPSTWIFVNGEQGFSSPSALPLNTWSHLAATYDGTALRLYVNGIQLGSQALTGSMFSSGQNLGIGGNTVWGAYEYFHGLIDEIRIYNRALSGSEIQSDMNTPVGP